MKNSLFYLKLAITNIKNNSKTYLPYILTCVGTVLMFYNMASLSFNNSTGDGSLASMMSMGTVVVGIFSTIFIFYTNSFLIKRRKKEFGLFNVLGMEKKHVGKIMLWENTIVSATSIVVGLLCGILFSKLITLLLYKLLHFDPYYKFEIGTKALIITIILFCVIFTLTLISSLIEVSRANPVELLHSGAVGEKEPKSNWFITLMGVLTLGAGYCIALSVKKPLSVMPLFLVSVILVIIGTYCLFTAGSVVLLKILKKNNSYYYKTNHFVSLSGMIYRMKRNAVGLANICIMSTAVLVMVSTTISMYVGMEDLMEHRYPKDTNITFEYSPEQRPEKEILNNKVQTILSEDEMPYSDFFGYEYLNLITIRNGDSYQLSKTDISMSDSNASVIVLLSSKDYEALSGEKVSLKENEVITCCERSSDTIQIMNKSFNVKENVKNISVDEFSTWLTDMVYVVVDSPNIVDEMYNLQKVTYGDKANDIIYDVSFNFNSSDEDVIDYCQNSFIDRLSNNIDTHFDYAIRQLNIEQFYLLYGGLFFLGIFLGLLFLLATVLIIYYKQIVEGFEDKERFKIMQKVGMDKADVRKSINSQILTVFALPLLVAGIHIIVAFPILTKLLALLNLTNVSLFSICTVITVVVFAIFYSVIYLATSKVYYKIVNG